MEYEGYESRQLMALLGKASDVPGKYSRVDYLMMRLPRLDEAAGDEEADLAENLAAAD